MEERVGRKGGNGNRKEIGLGEEPLVRDTQLGQRERNMKERTNHTPQTASNLCFILDHGHTC